MDKNKICSAYNMKLDKDKYKRDRNVCKEFTIKRKEKATIKLQSKITNQKSIMLTRKITTIEH